MSTALKGLVTGVALMVTPALASADTSSTLTVVGTSDVSDSGLMPNLIQPAFQKAYPQYTFKYSAPPRAPPSARPRAARGVRAF